jgi:hypothetical protein
MTISLGLQKLCADAGWTPHTIIRPHPPGKKRQIGFVQNKGKKQNGA